MKFLNKYYLILPPAAMFYGMWMFHMEYPKGYPQTIMNVFVYGWQLLAFLFAVLAAGIVYQLQQNKKQQYIYSFPWTKKEIYRKSLIRLDESLLAAGIIYGIFCAVELLTTNNGSVKDVIICILFNASVCFAVCAVAQTAVIAAAYIWQGLLITLFAIYVMLPMIVQNLAFLIQSLLKVRASRFAIFERVIYESDYMNFLYPLNRQLDAIKLGTEQLWKAQYASSSCLCIAVLLLTGIFCLWFARHQFIHQDQAQNRILTRLSRIENKVIMTISIGMICFNMLSNHELYEVVFLNDRTWRTRIYEIFMWNKYAMGDAQADKMILQKINGMHMAIYFIMSFVIVYLAVTMIQTIRRKRYERDC